MDPGELGGVLMNCGMMMVGLCVVFSVVCVFIETLSYVWKPSFNPLLSQQSSSPRDPQCDTEFIVTSYTMVFFFPLE